MENVWGICELNEARKHLLNTQRQLAVRDVTSLRVLGEFGQVVGNPGEQRGCKGPTRGLLEGCRSPQGCSRRRAAKVFMIYEASEQMLKSGSCLARSSAPSPFSLHVGHCDGNGCGRHSRIAQGRWRAIGGGGGVFRWQQLDMDANTDIKIAL